MRGLILSALLLLVAVPAIAQDNDMQREERLRQAIETRFGATVREQLGLTDQQAMKLRETLRSNAVQRRQLVMRERELKQALAGQLRPGVAANADSVESLLDELLNEKVAYATSFRDEVREMDYLTAVQRAQFLVLRERLMERIQAAREGAGPGRRP